MYDNKKTGEEPKAKESPKTWEVIRKLTWRLVHFPRLAQKKIHTNPLWFFKLAEFYKDLYIQEGNYMDLWRPVDFNFEYPRRGL